MCNPAMRSYNPAILNKISISAIIYSHHNKPNPKLRKYIYKNIKEIPKLDLFCRSHVRRTCNPAIRSDALHHNHLHHLNHLQSSNKPEQQSEENTLTNRLKKSQNSFFFEDRT